MSAKEKWNVCSCIREKDFLSKEIHLCKCNDNPRSGDIVLVQIKNDKNGYSQIENQKGRHIDVYEGDSWVCVLGNRNSGTNVNGKGCPFRCFSSHQRHCPTIPPCANNANVSP